jgi:hypothetical protein
VFNHQHHLLIKHYYNIMNVRWWFEGLRIIIKFYVFSIKAYVGVTIVIYICLILSLGIYFLLPCEDNWLLVLRFFFSICYTKYVKLFWMHGFLLWTLFFVHHGCELLCVVLGLIWNHKVFFKDFKNLWAWPWTMRTTQGSEKRKICYNWLHRKMLLITLKRD